MGIKITSADVGRQVRLTNGKLDSIRRFDAREPHTVYLHKQAGAFKVSGEAVLGGVVHIARFFKQPSRRIIHETRLVEPLSRLEFVMAQVGKWVGSGITVFGGVFVIDTDAGFQLLVVGSLLTILSVLMERR